jgi:hypothetical protein
VMALEKNAMVPYTPARARICLGPIPRDLYKMAVLWELVISSKVNFLKLCCLFAHFDSTAYC